MWGEEIPGRIASKFCLVIGTQDVITCIKFGDDRLRGFWSAGCQNFPFPIDFVVVLTTALRCDKPLTRSIGLWMIRTCSNVTDAEIRQEVRALI